MKGGCSARCMVRARALYLVGSSNFTAAGAEGPAPGVDIDSLCVAVADVAKPESAGTSNLHMSLWSRIWGLSSTSNKAFGSPDSSLFSCPSTSTPACIGTLFALYQSRLCAGWSSSSLQVPRKGRFWGVFEPGGDWGWNLDEKLVLPRVGGIWKLPDGLHHNLDL